MRSNQPGIAFAVLLAPWAVVPVTFLYFLATVPSDAGLGLIVGLVGVSFAYIGTIAVGVPAYFFLRRLGVLRGWLLLLVGTVAGVLGAAFVDFHQMGLLWALCGGAVGLLGWWVLQWKNGVAPTQ